jgi:hypothetical protein
MDELPVEAREAPVSGAGNRTGARPPEGAQRLVLAVAVVAGVALRWWNLGGPTATYDESFSGIYSHLPISRIPAALRADDAHPPLDYLLRHWFGSTGDTLALRVPSAVIGCLTLAVVVWWMWRRDWFGVAVVVVTAISPFQIIYAHTARMYALAILCGTLVAALADRWLRRPQAQSRWLMGLALVLGLFDLASFLLLAGALVFLPGRRTDREAWRFRATVVGALGLWAAAWGLAFIDQARGQHSNWIPYTSPSAFLDAVNGLMSFYPVSRLAALVLVGLGVAGLRRVDPRLGRLVAWLFLLPLAAASVIGLRSHFLLSRALAPSAWAVSLALAAVIELARRRSAMLAGLAVAAVGLVLVRSLPLALTFEEDTAPAVAAVAAAVRPGDAVVVSPDWLAPLVEWNDGAPPHPQVPSQLARLAAGNYVYVAPGAPFDGRLWVLSSNVYPMHPSGATRCPGHTPVGPDYTFTCYELPVTPPG